MAVASLPTLFACWTRRECRSNRSPSPSRPWTRSSCARPARDWKAPILMETNMTELAVPVATPTSLPQWRPWRHTVRAITLLGAREVRLALRTPAYLIPNLIVPIFFYFVTLGSLKEFAANSGLSNWEGFLLPMSLIFAVQG